MRPFVWLLAVAMGIPGTSILSPAIQNEKPASATQEITITKEFSDRIKAYVALQKKAEGSLPGLKSSNNSAEIASHALTLRAMIIEARPNMQQGNIFTPEISAYFKSIIRKTFQEPGSQVVRRTVQEGDPPKPIVMRVNGVYPDDSPVVTTPPTLLSRLPQLPMELTYRILGHTFVLLDSKTNLIVDFIPDAIP
jgi:hypothetical protein